MCRRASERREEGEERERERQQQQHDHVSVSVGLLGVVEPPPREVCLTERKKTEENWREGGRAGV